MYKNLKITVKAGFLAAVVLVIGFFLLWKSVDQKSTQMVNQQITNQMTDAVESRAAIIDNYVTNAEEYMIAFSKAEEVRNVFLSNEGTEEIAKAQKYTEEFAAVKGIFEGLYIANKNTHILVHSTPSAVGVTTRKGDELAPFQAEVFAQEKVTNYGIMPSRATGEMCISTYFPVFYNGTVIGYVGSAVFANQLMDTLTSLPVTGLPESEYLFLNVSSGEYIYNKNEELICTVTEDPGCLQMLETLRNDSAEDVGMIEYTDLNGVDQILVYKNIPERNWVFAVKDTRDHVFSAVDDVRKSTGLLSAVIALIVIAILMLVMFILGNALKLICNGIQRLGNMDLSPNEALKKYSGQTDEVGVICRALEKTSENLSMYISEVHRCLSAMAKGDFTSVSKAEFEGEFKKLKASMDMIQGALRNSFKEIGVVTDELVVGSQSVSDSAARLAEAAGRSSILVSEIDEHVEDISGRVAISAKLAETVKGDTNEASTIVSDSRSKMEELSASLNDIHAATSRIEGISNKMEAIAKQTNILALNALVEASRAGDTGKGFAVVANEIRLLAEESNEAAGEAYSVIHEAIASVDMGLKIGEETRALLEQVVAQTTTIDDSVSRIADETKQQNERLAGIRDRLLDIGKVVEITANMSQQSAAASIELDGQTNVLKDNIRKYRV